MKFSVNINVTDIRKEASNLTERINQALFNELADILESGNDMSKVRLRWLRRMDRESISLSSWRNFIATVRTSRSLLCRNAYERPDKSSRRLTYIPYGCRLYGNLGDGWLEVQSERYGQIFISETDIIDSGHLRYGHPRPDLDDWVQEAEKFLGVPYLWGGRSFFGLDCSGLAGLIAARFGVNLTS